jgi:hypothetical protein
MDHMFGQSSPGFPGFLLPLTLIGFASASFAQPVVSSTPSRERTVLAESYAKEKLWVWQKRLGLQDWNVTLEIVRSSELKPRTLGNIHWDTDRKTATIRVLDPADYTLPPLEMLADMEFTVVHELIHLDIAPVLSHFTRSDADRRDEEHAVNHMADALLHLDRGR